MSDANWPAGTRALLDEILTDAHGEDEQLWALRQAFADTVDLPCEAFIPGSVAEVLEVDYAGNVRQGLVARCRTPGGQTSTVAAWQLAFLAGSAEWRLSTAYRMWMGLDGPLTAPERPPADGSPNASAEELDLSAPLELVVLAPKERGVRCRLLGTASALTLRTSAASNMVPGEILTVRGRKHWRYARHAYLTGDVEGARLDVPALGLTPLRLLDEHTWDPAKAHWKEEGPVEDWERAILAWGPRPSFEMEQVRPGVDPDGWDSDPVVDAMALRDSGDWLGARKALVDLLAEDLRFLDSHAHLGNLVFDRNPSLALRHYEVGVRIGELSLGPDFDGLLAWVRLDNRPFMRCMHGYGLCLWRLGRREEAERVFERMLWLNPNDNQGIRSLLPQVKAGGRWEDQGEE